MKVDRREAFRYMKMGAAEPDGELMRRFEAIERELVAAARPRSVHCLLPVSELPGESADLMRALAGCRQAFLLAVTLGAEMDGRLRRLAARSAVDGLIGDAIATALIESAVEDCVAALGGHAGGAMGSSRPTGGLTRRFSPGYGDLPLAYQKELLAKLDATRRIGLTLTDACLMVPTKSVTAIVGVKVGGWRLKVGG